MSTRRDFLNVAGAALTASALAGAKDAPVLGLIFPPIDRPVPPEGLIMYPTQVKFIVQGLGLEALTPEAYEKAVPAIKPAAEKLAKQGANAIVMMGTSLTFFKGEAFNQQINESIKRATGLSCTTMSTAVIEGLKTVGAKRLSVATAYSDVVNQRLDAFLKEHGFEVLKMRGLGLTDMDAVPRVTEPELQKFSAGVCNSTPGANAMLVSCGGLRTLEILAPLEKETHVPVVSSTPHALRAGVRLLGLSGQAKGFGTLLAKG